MNQKKTSNDFARVLESALSKGKSEEDITVSELVQDLKKQLEHFIKTQKKSV